MGLCTEIIVNGGPGHVAVSAPNVRHARAYKVRARYDAAQTTDNNSRHWAHADSLSPNGAASPAVRQILRNRARYEVANNTYAAGIVKTLANDTVGTGPRLQLLTGQPHMNRQVERLFMEWAAEIGLAEKLRTMCAARVRDGEGIGVIAGNEGLHAPVKLDLRLVEAEMLASPWCSEEVREADGIEFDSFGNPRIYYIAKNHPGDKAVVSRDDFERVSPAALTHWFHADRPGQRRGVPELTPALPLFSQLRRYTLASLTAAETAANQSLTLETDAPAEDEAAPEMMDVVNLERGMATVLPSGYKLGQTRPEHPTTMYGDFKNELLREIARCVNMPFNIAAGNSAGYNYASGRLDHQTYFKSLRVDRSMMEQVVLDKIFLAWVNQAVLIEGFLPQQFREIGAKMPHRWFWDGHEHVDPQKEAKAQAIRLESMATSLAMEYARVGLDWEEQLEQIARERSKMKQLGLAASSSSGTAEPAAVTVDDDDQDEDEE